MSFGRNVCKEEIWRLPESPKTQKNLPEFHQQKLETLAETHDHLNLANAVYRKCNVSRLGFDAT